MLVRAGQPFCSPPKQIYQILLEHTNWITQMGLWGGGGTHGKAATKQRLGWADHSFRHFLKLINHAGSSSPSFYPLICLFVFLCLSVFLTLPPTLLLFLWGFWGLFFFTSPLIKENFVPLIFSSFPHLSLWFFFFHPVFIFFTIRPCHLVCSVLVSYKKVQWSLWNIWMVPVCE